MALFGLFRKPRCEVCQQETDEILTDNNEMHSLCRIHLIKAFEDKFLRTPFKLVINEFNPTATKYTGAVYGYYPISELEKYGWSKEDKQVLSELLNRIANAKSCASCNKSSISCLYISQAYAPWEKYGPGPHRDFNRLGQKLCLVCAYKQLEPFFTNNPKSFIDGGGLYTPYKEEGYYTTTEL